MRKAILWIALVCMSIVVSESANAQATCPDLVLHAVETVGGSCGEIGRNSVCYGNYRIDAVLTRALGVEFFDAPSDQIQLVDIQSLHTSPLDLDLEQWGIAVMNIQANLPEVLPGQVVTFLVIGDAELQNDVPLTADQLPTVMVITPTSLYNQPDAASAVLTPLGTNTALLASGVTTSGEWLRVTYDGVFGWVSRAALDPQAALGQLPILDAQAPLPMQAFTFRAAVGGPRCAEAPPAVLVMQGPEQVRVSLTVNGARMDLGSTAAIWQPAADMLQLAVFDGQVVLEDGTTIPRGFTVNVPLDDDAHVAGAWTEPRPLNVFEIAALLPLENMPANILHYPINVPEENERTPTPTFTPTRAAQPTRSAPRATLPPSPIPPSPIPPSPTPAAPIVNFTADSQLLNLGECTVLHWFTQNIDSVYIDGQPTIGESSQQVCPTATTTYVLLVIFRDGSQQTYSLTVQVVGPTSSPTSPAPFCGNQICDPGESSRSCPNDCATVCGNQICEPGEHMLNCTADCRQPVCGNLVCEPGESSCTCGGDCPGGCIG